VSIASTSLFRLISFSIDIDFSAVIDCSATVSILLYDSIPDRPIYAQTAKGEEFLSIDEAFVPIGPLPRSAIPGCFRPSAVEPIEDFKASAFEFANGRKGGLFARSSLQAVFDKLDPREFIEERFKLNFAILYREWSTAIKTGYAKSA
jgi:hypothetical protein